MPVLFMILPSGKFSGIGLEQILISPSLAGDISADGVIAADIEDVRSKGQILGIAASIQRNSDW